MRRRRRVLQVERVGPVDREQAATLQGTKLWETSDSMWEKSDMKTTMRTRRHRRMKLFALLSVSGLLAVGCSGSDGSTGPTANGESARETTSAEQTSAEAQGTEGEATAGGGESVESLAAAAAEEDPVLWYESTPEEDMVPLIEAFNAEYPEIEIEQIRLVGGTDIGARIVQENQAGAETADIATSGASTAQVLQERNVLAEIDGGELGIPDELMPNPHLIATAASVYVILYNSDLVPEDEAPESWEDLLDERWAGELGLWTIPAAQAHLAEEWGEERTTEYVQDLAALQPKLYSSTFPLAADVGAGEVPAALGILHAAQPTIDAGAPVEVSVLEPTPLNTIYSVMIEGTPSPNASKVFLHWLHTEEGAQAYENATGRGNPYMASEAAELLADVTIAEWPPGDTTYGELMDRYREILEEGASEVIEE